MRIAIILAALVAGPAFAQTTKGDAGTNLSVEVNAGAMTINYEYGYDGGIFVGYDLARDPMSEARGACTKGGGTFSTGEGGAFCTIRMPVRGRPLLMRFDSASEAEAACSTAGGRFSNREGRFACANPRRQLLARPKAGLPQAEPR